MTLTTAAGVVAGGTAFASAVDSLCHLTPVQTKGPFYPEQDQPDKDNDLTILKGALTPATGQLVYVMGQIQDADCNPIPQALVEIWQACASGRYNHSLDSNTAPLDPNFQYWGKAVTDSEGKYSFKTILPGAYPASATWKRPPHIHFKIQRLGYHELITQMYFAGQALNDKDLILQSLPAADKATVIVPLELPTANMEPDSRVCHFNITLRRVV